MTSVFTDPLPAQDVEKLGADIDVPGVERGMDALAIAADNVATLDAALRGLPLAYATWAQAEAQRSPDWTACAVARSRRSASRTSRPRARVLHPA